MSTLPLLLGLSCSTQPAPLPPPPPPELAWSCPLGPALGEVTLWPEVAAGRYDTTYSYDQDKLPTMERTSRVHVDGQAWLDLQPTGEMSACVGAVLTRSGSVSKYASHDGQHHSHEETVPHLFGLRGRWTQLSDGARLIIEQRSTGSCSEGFVAADAQLMCGTLRGPAQAVVACRPLGPTVDLSAIGLNLEDSPRAGPVISESVPMGREGPTTPRCGPWWVVGAGLQITSSDGRREASPSVRLGPGGAMMDERRYRRP